MSRTNRSCPVADARGGCLRLREGFNPSVCLHVQFMVCVVRSLPLYAGKHNAGTMSIHHMIAIALSGCENLPRLHGPGLNLPLLKNNFKATGVVNAVYWAIAPVYMVSLWTSSKHSRRPTDSKDCVNCNRPCEHEQSQESSNHKDAPGSQDWCMGPLIDFTPPPTTWDSTIPRVSKYHA